MSVKVMARVWAHSNQSGGALLVMLALADFANDDGECWPSIPVLAEKARLTERGIQYLLPILEQAGEIRRIRSNGGRNRRSHYFITVPENGERVSLKEFHRYRNGEKYSVKSAARNGESHFTRIKPSGTVNKRESTESDKPIPNSPSSNSKKKKSAAAPAATDPRVQPFLAWFAAEFERRYRQPYAATWAKDGKLIKALPSGFDLAKLKNLAKRFFESDDSWVREKGGFTIGVFVSQINKLSSTTNANGYADSQDPEWRKRTFVNA